MLKKAFNSFGMVKGTLNDSELQISEEKAIKFLKKRNKQLRRQIMKNWNEDKIIPCQFTVEKETYY